jgi:hypothetical protein
LRRETFSIQAISITWDTFPIKLSNLDFRSGRQKRSRKAGLHSYSLTLSDVSSPKPPMQNKHVLGVLNIDPNLEYVNPIFTVFRQIFRDGFRHLVR